MEYLGHQKPQEMSTGITVNAMSPKPASKGLYVHVGSFWENCSLYVEVGISLGMIPLI